jgi:hypothetical protein
MHPPTLARWTIWFLSFLSMGLTAFGADYKEGEEIEVFFLNEWLPAKVVDVNKQGLVQAKFEFANALKVEVFKPEAVRAKYESGAIWRGRMWSDASGSFKIKAALLAVLPDRVKLRKSDGQEIEVPIAKLSEADQKFLQKLRSEAGGGSPIAIAPKIEEFDLTYNAFAEKASAQVSIESGRKAATSGFRLDSDPLRSSLKLMQAGAGIPQANFFDNLGSVIPLGGPDGWMMVGVEDMRGKQAEAPTRIYWASLAKSQFKTMHSFPSGLTLLDYHVGSKMLLTYTVLEGKKAFEEEPLLTVWSVQPNSPEPTGVLSWRARLSDGKSFGHASPWARFVSENLVVQRDNDHRMIAWDIQEKRIAWTSVQQSFFAPDPLMSHGGKYLFLPEDQRLRILNPTTGQTLGSIETASNCSGVALHPDGRRLAILANQTLLVVDLTGEQPIQEIDASTVGSPFATKMEWVDDDLLALPGQGLGFVLFSIQHQLPVWSYQFDSNVYRAESRSGRARSIVDGHLCYAAALEGVQRGYVVGAVKLPEAVVLDALAKVNRKDYMLTGQGTRVRLQATGDHASVILEGLKKQVAENKWVESPTAEFVLQGEIKQLPSQTTQYTNTMTREVQTVSHSPIVSSISLQRGSEVVWEAASSSGTPPMVMLREGQSLQSEADKWQRPDIEFFGRQDVPQEVIDPKKRGGIGTSDVTLQGLVPRR